MNYKKALLPQRVLMKLSLHKPLFWIFFSSISIVCGLYAYIFFSQAFPIVNLSITMNRDQAIEQSKRYAQQFKWGPSAPFSAVSFDTDETTKTYVELEGGGQQTFITMLEQHWYEPYLWHVRLFAQFDVHEAHVYFTPDGTLYGFHEIVSDNLDLPSLKKSEALALAQQTVENYKIDMQPYQLVEASKHVQANDRVDRTFVFERSDISLKDGRFRIKVVVSGNKVTQWRQFVKVPELFMLTYRQMRSYNEAIATAGYIFSYIVYLLLGCIIGLFILLRLNWIIWKTPLKWAFFIALGDALMSIDSLPLYWMHYQTETSMQSFLFHIIVQSAQEFFTRFIMLGLIFTAAESLTRKAFPGHIQLWKSWSPGIANTYQIWGRTIGGYLMLGIDMAFLITFYMIATKLFGWWTPVSTWSDPNVLANYMPWFAPIVLSLGAGFMEECKYRAIPLASAALLGQRFGNRRLWIAAAFILQAIVFSAAHANYPAQPAYARLIELIIPSFIFAGIYLRFGLLTSIISHYAYDVILFALPIFCEQSSGGWINKIMVLILLFAPLWIIIYRTWTQGIGSAAADAYNRAYQHSAAFTYPFAQAVTIIEQVPQFTQKRAFVFTLISLGAWILFTPLHVDYSPDLKICKKGAQKIAEQQLLEYTPDLNITHKPYIQLKQAFLENTKARMQHKYVWQTFGKPTYYDLMGTYLMPPCFMVRFLRFEGSLTERSQEFETCIGIRNGSYVPLYWKQIIPEHIAGATLSKQEARTLAHKELAVQGYNVEELEEIKATPKQLPDRKDWIFVFGNKQPQNHLIKAGDLRIIISVSGNQITQVRKKIHVPEQFKRDYQNDLALRSSLQMFCQLPIWALFICGMLLALVLLAHQTISLRSFAISSLILTLIFTGITINNIPSTIAQFNTQAPFFNQLLNSYSMIIARYFIRITIYAFILSLTLAYKARYRLASRITTIITGIASGFIIQAAWSVISLAKPSLGPLWAVYYGRASVSPLLGFTAYYISDFINYTLGLTLCVLLINYVTDYGTKRLAAAFAACILICLCMTGIQSLEQITFWIVSSIALATVLFVVWYCLLRYCYAATIIAVATSFCLSIIQQMFFDVISHNIAAALVSIATIVALTYMWIIGHEQETIS